MDAIEKRARELLAAEYLKGGAMPASVDIRAGRTNWPTQMAVNAIIAALTPPEGYVLVPLEPTEAMIDAYDESGDARIDWAMMIAARPEVKP